MPAIGSKIKHHRFGVGVVVAIDLTTYSIPMIVCDYEAGQIIRPLYEVQAA